MWDSLSAAERRLLVAIAETTDAELFSTMFLQKYRLGAASSVQRIAERLKKKGIIDRTGKGFHIVDPIFMQWVTRGESAES
jgi:predicted transcriptional regulator of viral defense system